MEETDIICLKKEYGRNRHHMSKEKKQILKEYQKNYRKA